MKKTSSVYFMRYSTTIASKHTHRPIASSYSTSSILLLRLILKAGCHAQLKLSYKTSSVLEKAGAQVYALFSNAAAGERDPRCLLKVFSIFVRIMEQLDLSILMEDMFELVACYYPIEYKPVHSNSPKVHNDWAFAALDWCQSTQPRGSVGCMRSVPAR